MRNTQYTSSVRFEINVKSLMSCVEKLYVSRISLLILVFKRQGSKTFNQDDRDDVDHSMSVDRHCHSFVGLIATPQVDTVCIKEFFYLSWLFSIFVQIFVLYFSRFVCVCPDFFIFVLTFFNRLGLFIFVCWPMVSDHSMSVDWICHSFVLYNSFYCESQRCITVCTIHRMFLRDRPLCHCVTLPTAQLHLSWEMVECLLTIVKRPRVHALRYGIIKLLC